MNRRFTSLSIRTFRRGEDGASLIEYSVVISLFLLVFFAILDFGRLGFNWVMTEKAMQRAARIATVRPPVCAGVPEIQDRAPASSARFGTLCRVGGVCASVAPQSCVLGGPTAFDATNPCTAPVVVAGLPNNPTQAQIDARNAQLRLQTAQEIWCVLEPILPSNATPNNIRVSYRQDPNSNLGFAGGPYIPMVEVGIVTAADTNITGSAALRFEFITPIPALAAMAGNAATTIDAAGTGGASLPSIPFPDLSVSLPGEDLNQGTEG